MAEDEPATASADPKSIEQQAAAKVEAEKTKS
jgi:hypothetical protein